MPPKTVSALLEQIHPADQGHLRAGLTSAQGEGFETVCRLRSDTDDPRWVHLRITEGTDGDRLVAVEPLDAEAHYLTMLAHRNDQLETMLATVPECFKIVDRGMRLIDMNATGIDMIEAPDVPSVAGANVLDLLLPEHQDAFTGGIQRALLGERNVLRFEIQGLQGTRRWMEQVAVALPARYGKTEPDQVAAFTREITEDLKLVRNLSDARERADAANAAKSEFLANVSHEIRTPLTAILGFAELLDDGALDEAAADDAICTIRRNGAHLLAMINDLLDISKIEANELLLETLSVDAAALLADIVELHAQEAVDKGLTLNAKWVGTPPPAVSTDPNRLRQVLINLVNNAIKFTESGSVSILAEYRDVGQQPELSIRVTDTGVGIAEEAREAIFESFAQADSSTSRRFGGTGLGLTISRRLARLLGGDLRVRSAPGTGSEFELTVAAPSATPVAATPAIHLHQDASRRPDLTIQRVLLAEDGRDNQRLISFHLNRAGANVTIVEDGVAAIEALANGGEANYDLILMDIQMPRMDGLEATRRIRSANIDLPIIALTANARNEDREQAFAAGCSAFLTKPLDVEELLRTMSARGASTAP